MMVAQAAINTEYFHKARLALQKIPDDRLTPRACRLWAHVEEMDGGTVADARAWLERATALDRDPTWTCKTCGAIADRWTALCGHCGAFDTLDWKTPAHVTVVSSLPDRGGPCHRYEYVRRNP